MSKMIRVDVPEEVFDALTLLAAADGLKIGRYVKTLLIQHAENRDTSIPDVGPTVAEWQALVRWVGSHPERWATYDGPRDVGSAADRAVIYRWYQQQIGE